MINPLYQVIRAVIQNKSASALIAEFLFFGGLIVLVVITVNTLLSHLIGFSSPLLAENIENLASFNLSFIDFENPLTQETLVSLGGGVQNIAVRTPLLLIDLFLLTYITYYFLKSSDYVYESVFKIIPPSSKQSIKNFITKVNHLTKEIIYGYFLTAFMITLLTFILLTLIGIEYSVDYSLINGLMSIIPVIGNWILPLFLAFYYFFKQNYLFTIIFIIFAMSTSSLIKMIRPIISRSKYNIHPVLFIIGVIVGFYSLGFFGFLFGPIIFGVAQIGFEQVFKKETFKNIK